jgi:hypothetical protein
VTLPSIVPNAGSVLHSTRTLTASVVSVHRFARFGLMSYAATP